MDKKWTAVIKSKDNPFRLNIKEHWKYKDLIWLFVQRDFKTRYKQTVLGPLWFLIAPLFTTVIYTIIYGKIIFNGDVEEAINIYLGREKKEYNNNIIVTDSMRDSLLAHPNMRIEKLLSFSKDNIYKTGEKLRFKITINNDKKEIRNVLIRAVIFTQKGILVGMCFNDKVLQISHGENDKNIEIDISKLAPEKYLIDLVLLEQGCNCASKIDVIKNIFYFEVEANDGFYNNMKWNPNWWGYTYGRIDEVESTNL